jgi:hypothetical protein
VPLPPHLLSLSRFIPTISFYNGCFITCFITRHDNGNFPISTGSGLSLGLLRK